jgi:polar amino acid transport system permease protein
VSVFSVWAAHYGDLLHGLWVSLQVTAVSLIIGLPAALGLAICVRSDRWSVRVPVIAFVEIGRGIPTLVLLQVVYFAFPSYGLTLSGFIATAATLAVSTAVYASETFRGGLQAVPKGTGEAANALGLSRADAFRFITLPQMIRIVIPPIMSQSILVFQASSLAYTISLAELMSHAYSTAASTFQYLDIFALAGLIYAAITVPASLLTGGIEQRLGRHLQH